MKPYYQDDQATIYNADSVEVLCELRESFDLVVADPPYTTGIVSFGENSKASGWGDIMNSAHFNAAWLRECKRLLENAQGAAWVFNSWKSLPILARASFEIQWPIISVLIWDKEWIGPGSRGLRPSYELAALFAHNQFSLKNRGLPDIWRHKWSSHKPNGHPAEKPVSLIARIIRESGSRRVLDPFLGSGTTLEAAKQEGVVGVGIEIEERWCEVAAKRLQQGILDKKQDDVCKWCSGTGEPINFGDTVCAGCEGTGKGQNPSNNK
jgi:site-specific DNA-methyltransferase (adenine-specific)